MATSLKMSLTTVGKSGPPYTRVQSGHDLIRGDLRLGLPCELLIEGQIRGHLIFWSIQAMTEVNAKYVPTRRKVADLIQNRKDKISSLVETFEAYESLNEKVSKAVDFYEKLAKNTSDLQTKVQKSVVDKKKEAKAALDMMTKGTQKIFISNLF